METFENQEVMDALPRDGEGEQENGSSREHRHRHHSRAYYKYRYKKHKLKKYVRKRKVLFSCIALVLCAVVAVGVIAKLQSRQKKPVPKQTSSAVTQSAPSENYMAVKLPYFHEPQLLVDPLVATYVHNEELPYLSDLIADYSDKERPDGERRVRMLFNLDAASAHMSVAAMSLKLADNEAFRHARICPMVKNAGYTELKFLIPDTTYYYQLSVTLENGETVTSSGSFQTAPSPRLLTVEGALNVRDIGGWQTKDGKTVKYGMLFRGSEIDGIYDKALTITDTGIAEMHQYLGITSDFDIRGLTTSNIPKESPLGSKVRHKIYGAYQYSDVLEPAAADYIHELFSDLADQSNYPVYLHCSYGRDRTGTACYLLEAMLGVREEDLIRDFDLSTLAYRDGNHRAPGGPFDSFVQDFQKLKGKTTQEKAENYLCSCGITDEQIKSIKDIFLED